MRRPLLRCVLGLPQLQTPFLTACWTFADTLYMNLLTKAILFLLGSEYGVVGKTWVQPVAPYIMVATSL